jgi:hypothetical protein
VPPKGLNGSQAFATHATAIRQGGATIFARVAIQKTMLPFATDF